MSVFSYDFARKSEIMLIKLINVVQQIWRETLS